MVPSMQTKIGDFSLLRTVLVVPYCLTSFLGH